ncbi:MAG: family N-acetyltransferase [Candidatus Midichloriaceae bacterium]|jgi:ribosomal protein S18 acetylase RimI-like enzyme|nr:family N-acetyltransferase [Candidatus Midichloriaceae bacterium]
MNSKPPKIEAIVVKSLNPVEMEDLCDSTMKTMRSTTGFNVGNQHIQYMEKAKLMSYWEGVLLIPERMLIVGKLDGTIAGSIQVIMPSPSNQTSKFACAIDNYFLAPWARGYKLSDLLIETAEQEIMKLGLSIIKLSVRETRTAAIKVFERHNYIKWGVLPKYEIDQDKVVAGYFYYKELLPIMDNANYR